MGRPSSTRGQYYDTTLARNLRALVERFGENRVKRFADERGLAVSTVNRIVNGTMDPSLSTIQKISDATGYTLPQLLSEEFDPAGGSPPMLRPEVAWLATRYSLIQSPLDQARVLSIIEQALDVPVPSFEPASIASPRRGR